MVKQRKPMYKQIEQYIMNQIQDRLWEPLSQIPSENELSKQFNVSRITVKNALLQLVEKGVVYRLQGKGTFVAKENHIGLSNIALDEYPLSSQRIIGFLMPRLDNRSTANVLSGIEDVLSENGYKMLFSKTNNSQDEEIKKIVEMKQANVQGLIIYPVEGEIYNNEILSLTLNQFPLVLVDRILKGIMTNSVISDNYDAGVEAVKYLCGLGHKSIGFISTKPEGTTSIEERIAGYEHELQNNHIPIDRNLRLTELSLEHSDEEVILLIQRFLLANPNMTAVLSANFSPHVIQAAIALGIGVPEDLSVLFFDDISYPDFAMIPPTVIAQDEYIMGQESARLIISQIENNVKEYKRVKLSSNLIVRKSTASPKNLSNN
jgi:GntR family transcriptional regulator of arabinose operon